MLFKVHKVNCVVLLSLIIFLCIPSIKALELDINIFSGYDNRDAPIGTYVFMESIKKHSTEPVKFTILDEGNFEKKGWLPSGSSKPSGWDPKQMSPFGRSRFLTPHLSHYKGWSLFCDGADMLVQENIAKLWALRNPKYAVMVVKHDDVRHVHPEHTNHDRKTEVYPKFNWSSVMLFNNEKCGMLTAEYVKNAPYLDLHQFKWLAPEDEIGELPKEWNYLVGYSPPQKNPSLIHWTLGPPLRGGEFKKAEFADVWFSLAAEMLPLHPLKASDD